MVEIYRPLQVSFNHRVLEQNRKFFFIASASLGVNLQTGESLLDFDLLKDAFECMGGSPLPDIGMPKPSGEVLVSGKYFSTDGKPVTAHNVGFGVESIQKTLNVFGNRYWERGGGLGKSITDPTPFTEMEIGYHNSFGGEGYKHNPFGKGFTTVMTEEGETVHPLPNVEDPKNLIGSPQDTPLPAGFGPLDSSYPKRMLYSGTYDENYKRDYFPGYPADLDWRHFLCAPEDQQIKEFFKGDERFSISHMHPDLPIIEGQLPDLYARCFIRRNLENEDTEFVELPLNLDTIWFFPEKLMAQLIWRKGIEVTDDEAEEITHVLTAFEDRAHTPRKLEDYQKSLDLRMNSDDPLLNYFNTEDLIPIGALCAMEILQEKALSDVEESEFGKNLDAKSEALQKQADEKIEEAILQNEKNMSNIDIPDASRESMPDGGDIDLRKLVKEQTEGKPDPDVDAMKLKLEAILPGITAGDPKKLELKNFSFDKIDQIMDAVDELADKKEKEAKEMVDVELEKAKKQIDDQLEELNNGPENSPKEVEEKLRETKKQLDEFDLDNPPASPLPRVNADELIAQLAQVSPEVMGAMAHLEHMKNAGIENENTNDLENQVRQNLDSNTSQAEEALREAEIGFKETYVMSAHFMEDGLSPHKEPVELVAKRLLADISAGEKVSDGDWACIDLSGQNLDGVDLSGAYLEQVNFTGASLKGANLSNSIMARANLEDADLTGADLTEANVGGVHALRANFTDVCFKSAKLSKGDFTDADFTRATLEDVETLEIVVNGTNFFETHMTSMTFIEIELLATKFSKAELNTTTFLNCSLKDVDFSEAIMPKCTFANTKFENVGFDKANLEGSCFATSDPEKSEMNNLRFKGAILKSCNFQDMEMKGCDLSDADLESANFGGADLSEANLSRTFAKQAQFRKARLKGAILNGINLMEGSLSKAYLVDASFVGANLYMVDFLRSTITNTDFRGSNLDNTLIEEWRPE